MSIINRVSNNPNLGTDFIKGSPLTYNELDGNFASIAASLAQRPIYQFGAGLTLTGTLVTSQLLTVNGISPVNGNIDLSITQTLTGTLNDRPITSDDGTIYVVSGDPTVNNNGLAYIWASNSWQPIAPADQAANDARYLRLAGGTMAGNINLAGFDITNGGTFYGTASVASFVTGSNIYGPHGANSVESASFAISASYASESAVSSVALFVTGANVYGPLGSNSIQSASYALTASYVLNAAGTSTDKILSGSTIVQTYNSGLIEISGSSTIRLKVSGTINVGNNLTSGIFSIAHGNVVTASGDYSHAEGYQTKAIGDFSHTEGYVTNATNTGAHAEGYVTIASGVYSHAEGGFTTANGIGSHAEGLYTLASGQYSHAEGSYTTASGQYSHAEGYYTTASGQYSHAEGFRVNAANLYSHAEGYQSLTNGIAAHAEGYQTVAGGQASHAEGYQSIASGSYAHAEGFGTNATGNYTHAEGLETVASGSYSHVEGQETEAYGLASHAEGFDTTAIGDYSHAEGNSTTASGSHSHAQGDSSITYGVASHAEGGATAAYGNFSHAEGYFARSAGVSSHAEGYYTVSSGSYSHTEGSYTTASGVASHAEGYFALSSGSYSHAEGTATRAIGESSHAEGYQTYAIGNYSHAEGGYTIASGSYSHAEGYYTIASGSYQTVVGQYNQRGNSTSLFVVGNGSGDADANRSDIMRVDPTGVVISGSLNVSGSTIIRSLTTSSVTLTNVLMISSSGQVFVTASSAIVGGSVRTVNGASPDPTTGNVAVSITTTYTGYSSSLSGAPSLQASASGQITASFSNGALWIVTGETDPARTGSNGETYIFSSGSVGQWTFVPNYSQNAADARYLVKSTGGTVSGNITLDNSAELYGTSSWARQAITASYGNITGSLFGTASWARSASSAINAQTASFLPVGTYQITASWAVSASRAVTASYVTGSIFTSTNPALTSSYAVTASYALNAGGFSITIKASSASAASFQGSPLTSSVLFGSAFGDNNYILTVTGEDARAWSIQSKSSTGFTINSNSDVALTGPVFWIATPFNNS